MNDLLQQLLDAIATYQSGTVRLRQIVGSATSDELELYHLVYAELPESERAALQSVLDNAGVEVPYVAPRGVVSDDVETPTV